jgi:predicted nuclease of predicted toxin-antitoxin system
VKGFLLDENLPTRLTFSPSLPVSHARDFGGNPSDSELWDLAGVRQWVIAKKAKPSATKCCVKLHLDSLTPRVTIALT